MLARANSAAPRGLARRRRQPNAQPRPPPHQTRADTGGLVKDSWHEYEWKKINFLQKRFGGWLSVALTDATTQLLAFLEESARLTHARLAHPHPRAGLKSWYMD